MAFVKEFRDIMDEFPEREYLTEIGVRNMFGRPIRDGITELVVDRERNYYLFPQGQTLISREEKPQAYYALCLDGIVLNMEVTENASGSGREKNYEVHWDIEKINFPKHWTFDKISKNKLIKIIKEAFIIETYTKTLTKDKVKSLTVKVSALED